MASSCRFFDQYFVCISQLPLACYIPAHLILLHLVTILISGKAYKV
jgi:hypothetical protein